MNILILNGMLIRLKFYVFKIEKISSKIKMKHFFIIFEFVFLLINISLASIPSFSSENKYEDEKNSPKAKFSGICVSFG